MSKYPENDKICSEFNNRSAALSFTEQSSRPYLAFYNLHEPPFSITPDPEFLYMSMSHRDVLEKILYGIRARMGFLLMIGEVGAGKTTLCRRILDELKEKAETVYLINPSLSGMDLIKSILDDLGISCPADASKKESLDLLNGFLLEKSEERPVVIIIDDAQTMTIEGLETLRLLSNLETDKEKLLQIILAGQEELLEILSGQEIRQLRQRIAISCRLEVLKKSEIPGYISHRLFVAGDKGGIRFSTRAISRIYGASKGIPRLINRICDYSLMAGFVSNSTAITGHHAGLALAELDNNLWMEGKKPFAAFFRSVNLQTGMALSALFLLILAGVFTGSKFYFNTGTAEYFNNQGAAPVFTLTRGQSISGQTKQKTENSQDANADPQKARAPEARQADVTSDTNPFILQLASFKNKSDVLRAVPQYEDKNIPVQWNPVDIGDETLWYRLFAGRFPSVDAAEEFRREKEISEGIVIKAPWTILIAASDNKNDLSAQYSRLVESGYDCILDGDDNSGYKLATGAFITSEGASRIAEELAGMGFDAKAVRQ